MKKTVFTKSVLRVLPLGLFFMVVGFASCNNDLNMGNGLSLNSNSPADSLVETGNSGCISGEIHAGVPEEIVSFFDSNGKAFVDYFYSCYNSTSWPSFPWDTCCLVNSRAELQEMYIGNEELPEIDFDKNSLIIGLAMENDAHTVNIRSIDMKDDSIFVYVKSEEIDYDHEKYAPIQACFPYFIWELFEKLPQKKIVLKR